MGNPIYAVPKSKSEFTHVYIQVSRAAVERDHPYSLLPLAEEPRLTLLRPCSLVRLVPPSPFSRRRRRSSPRPRNPQLRVRDQSGSDVYFKMKRRLPLGLLQDAYCQREQLDLSKLCFLYKGRRIIPDETPEELDMEQVVTVDVVKLD